MLFKQPEVLKLIGVNTQSCTSRDILAALAAGQDACSKLFLAKVSKLQLLEDAVACELVRAQHPLLRASAAGANPETTFSFPGHQALAPSAPPPQLHTPAPSGSVHQDPSDTEGTRQSMHAIGTDAQVLGNLSGPPVDTSDALPMCRSPPPATSPTSPARNRGARASDADDLEHRRQAQREKRQTEPTVVHREIRTQGPVDTEDELGGVRVKGLTTGGAIAGDPGNAGGVAGNSCESAVEKSHGWSGQSSGGLEETSSSTAKAAVSTKCGTDYMF